VLAVVTVTAMEEMSIWKYTWASRVIKTCFLSSVHDQFMVMMMMSVCMCCLCAHLVMNEWRNN